MLSDERGRLTDDGEILPNIREVVQVVGQAEKYSGELPKGLDG